jgi:hypothetical protein
MAASRGDHPNRGDVSVKRYRLDHDCCAGRHMLTGAPPHAYWRRARMRARIGKPVKAYTLRHSFATHLVEAHSHYPDVALLRRKVPPWQSKARKATQTRIRRNRQHSFTASGSSVASLICGLCIQLRIGRRSFCALANFRLWSGSKETRWWVTP